MAHPDSSSLSPAEEAEVYDRLGTEVYREYEFWRRGKQYFAGRTGWGDNRFINRPNLEELLQIIERNEASRSSLPSPAAPSSAA